MAPRFPLGSLSITVLPLLFPKMKVVAIMSSWSPWEDASYCWVVICKNRRFHRHAGTDIGYKIPLAETDAFSPRPDISAPFPVRCPDCSEEYSYKPEDIQRVELNLVDSFAPHPRFRDKEPAV